MDHGYWILKDKKAVKVNTVQEWGAYFEKSGRIVKQTHVGPVFVSTVFLGIDHNFSCKKDAPVLLFETMIFGGKNDDYTDRYSIWEEAEIGHELAVNMVQKTIWIDWLYCIWQYFKNIVSRIRMWFWRRQIARKNRNANQR